MELKTARKVLGVRRNASWDEIKAASLKCKTNAVGDDRVFEVTQAFDTLRNHHEDEVTELRQKAKQGKKFGNGFFAALGEIGKNVLEFMAEHKLLTAWLAASVAGFAVSAPGLGDSMAALLAAMGTGFSAIISAAAAAFAIDKNGDGFYTDGEFKAVLAACIAAVLLNAGGCGLVIKDIRDTNAAFEQQVNAAKAEIFSQGTFSQEELDMADKLDLDELLITMAERPEEFASKLAAMREKILTSDGVMTPKNISQLRMLLILNGEAEEDLDYNKIFKLFEEKER